MNIVLKSIGILAVAGLMTGCTAHGGGFNNQTGGTVIGGLTGAVVGNQFGKGRGKTAATALGAVIGAMTGNSVGAHMDRPAGQTVTVREPQVIYKEKWYRERHTGHRHSRHSCSRYYDRGERAACLRGVAQREQAEQRAREKRAYDRVVNRCGPGRRWYPAFLKCGIAR